MLNVDKNAQPESSAALGRGVLRGSLGVVLAAVLVAPLLGPVSFARAESEAFAESFGGASLASPASWVSSRGPTGNAPPQQPVPPAEYACLTALAPGEQIEVARFTATSGTDRPGTGLIVGCPSGTADPIDEPGSGVLRLTGPAYSQSAVVLYTAPQKMSDGLDISFTFAMYGGIATGIDLGADGLSFFIKDGSNALDDAGVGGGSLGYALNDAATVQPGVPGALLGVGFDLYRNFSFARTPAAARACGASPFATSAVGAAAYDRVVLRGPDTSTTQPQDGTCGYEFLGRSTAPVDFGRAVAGAPASPPSTTRAGAARRARIVIDKPGPDARVKVYVWPVGTDQPATEVLDLPQPAQLLGVETFKFGFGAGSGWATNIHEIWDLQIVLADPVVQALQAAEAEAAAEAAAAAGTESAGAGRPALVCAPDPVVRGSQVRCSVDSGPSGFDILWTARIEDRIIGSAGVTLDARGIGEFSFRAPADAADTVITVELVDWGVETNVGVVGGPVPSLIDAGSSGRSPAGLELVPLLTLPLVWVLVRRRHVRS